MSTRYFQPTDRYPRIIRSLLNRVLIFMSQTLYPDEYAEDPETAYKRMIIAAPDSSDKERVRRAISSFEKFSSHYPFTTYSVAESERGDIFNWASQSGTKYFEEIGRKGGAVHQILTIPMVSFFNRADDYWQARSRIIHATSVLTRLFVPITINEIIQETRPNQNYAYTTSFPIDLAVEITKGDFAFEFEQYLIENKVWNIRHDIKVRYYDFAFSEYLGDMSVTEMILNLSQSLVDGNTHLLNTVIAPDDPEVVSTSPADGATAVAVTIPQIDIIFQTPMKENDTEFKITFDPPVFGEWGWSSDSKTLTMYPYVPLAASTEYTVEIPANVTDMYSHSPVEDYVFKFTTAV